MSLVRWECGADVLAYFDFWRTLSSGIRDDHPSWLYSKGPAHYFPHARFLTLLTLFGALKPTLLFGTANRQCRLCCCVTCEHVSCVYAVDSGLRLLSFGALVGRSNRGGVVGGPEASVKHFTQRHITGFKIRR